MNKTHAWARGRINHYKILLGTLMVMLAALATACHNYQANVDEALAAGRLDAALAEAREGVKDEPKDPERHLLLARVQIAREDWSAARRPANRAARGLPKDPQAQVLYGRVQYELKSYIKAANYYLRAKTLSEKSVQGQEAQRLKDLLPKAIEAAIAEDKPEAAEEFILALRDLDANAPEGSEEKLQAARESIGRKLFRTGRYREAAEHYAKLIELYPDQDGYHLERGSLLLLLGETDEATKAFDLYSSRGDNKAARYDEIATRANLRDQRQMAITYWNKALEADASNADVHFKLADLFFLNDQHTEAYETLRKGIKAGANTPKVYLQAASVAEGKDRGDIAVELLQEASTQATADFAVTRQLSLLLLRRQRRSDMEDALRLYIDRSSNKNDARLDAISFLQEFKEYDIAVFYVDQLLADPKAPVEVWLIKADLEAAAGRTLEMAQALRDYLKRSKRTPKDYQEAATRAQKVDAYDDAVSFLLEGLKTHKEHPDLLMALANLYETYNELDKERATLMRWVATQPKPPKAALSVANRLLGRSDIKGAIPFLKRAESDPELADDAALLLGEGYMKRGLDKEMRQAFDRYLGLVKDRPKALRRLLQLYRKGQRYEDALATVEELIKLDPKDAELQMTLGDLLLELGDTEKAVAALKAYLKGQSDPFGATTRVVRLLERRNQHRLALEFYDALSQDLGSSPEMFGQIGELYWNLSRKYAVRHPNRAQQYEDAARGFFLRYIDEYSTENNKWKPRLGTLAASLARRAQWQLAAKAFERVDALGLKLKRRQHLDRGQTMLWLGKDKAAEASFETFTKPGENRAERWFDVGDTCMTLGRYEMALRYLRKVIDAPKNDYVKRAYNHMVRIHIQRGTRDQIRPLSIDLLTKAGNTFNTQQLVARSYTSAGLFELAIEEYEDLLGRSPNNTAVVTSLAEILYMAGDADKARAKLKEASKNSSDPVGTWTMIGNFYIDRGELEMALEALTAAEEAGGTSADVRIQRGLILALRGQYEAADQALRSGLDMAGDHEKHYRQIFDTLAQIPNLTLAERYITEAAARAKDNAAYKVWLVETAFERGDVARGVRELRKAGLLGRKPADAITWLLESGYPVEALEVLRTQIQNGQSASLQNALFPADGGAFNQGEPTLADAVLGHGGIDRLPMLYRPMLEALQSNPDNLHAGIGMLYANLGRDDLATVHLTAASKSGPRHSDLELGQLHFRQGDRRQARASFTRFAQQHKENPSNFLQAVSSVIHVYTTLGALDDAQAFVRDIMARPERRHMMVAPMAEVLLLAGDHAQALNLIRTGPLVEVFKSTNTDNATTPARVADLVAAARAVASHGFEREALKLLTDAYAQHTQHSALLLAMIEMGARQSHPQLDDWAKAFIQAGKDNADDLYRRRLRLADAYTAGNALTKASDILNDLVSSREIVTARMAISRLIALHRRTNNLKALEKALDAHVDSQGDRYNTLLDQARFLRNYGFFGWGAERYSAALKLSPDGLGRHQALVEMYALGGNKDGLLASAARANRAGRVSNTQRIAVGHFLTDGPDAAMAQAYWQQLTTAMPALAPGLLGSAQMAYLQGQGDAARSQLRAYLDQDRDNPLVLGRALSLLGHLRRWQDIEDIVRDYGPKEIAPNPDSKARLAPMTPRSYLLVGMARYARGDRNGALSAFDLYTRVSSSPLASNLTVARAIADAAPSDAKAETTARDKRIYIDRAVSETPNAAAPYLDRGLAELELGRLEPALGDFKAYLQRGGPSTVQALQTMGRALLERGHIQKAHPFLLRLAKLPILGNGAGMALALGAFDDAGRFKEGLEFLQSNAPQLAAAPQLDLNLLSATAELYAGAGQIDRAVALYNLGTNRYPNSGIILNNLAYLMARNNKDLDRAQKLARRALATPTLTPHEQGLYFDTLALILLKQGDAKAALNAQRRALRLTRKTHPKLHVLFTHLADIHKALGQDDAAKLARYRSTLAKQAQH